VNTLLCWINGLLIVIATINPANNAVAGVKNGTKNNNMIKIVSRLFCDKFSIIDFVLLYREIKYKVTKKKAKRGCFF
jgi:hypothetical protein